MHRLPTSIAHVVVGTRTKDLPEDRRVSLLTLCCLALVIGMMTGVGAVIFRALIAFVHNASYNGRLSFVYDANSMEGPSRFGDFVLLSPVLGGLIVVFLVRRFAPEAKGHGVPEVMDAIFYSRGKIRGTVAVIKALASALSIGTGAAVGREGPIIQIGSALGSAFSQFIALSPWQESHCCRRAPVPVSRRRSIRRWAACCLRWRFCYPRSRTALFCLSSWQPARRLLSVRILIGPSPAFAVPDVQLTLAKSLGMGEALSFVLLGLLCGLAAWVFIRLLVLMEDSFPRLSSNEYVQNSHRHVHDRIDDGPAHAGVRSFVCRWRRLFGDPGGFRPEADSAMAFDSVVRAQAGRDHGQPWERRVRRHFLAISLHGGDAGRRLCGDHGIVLPHSGLSAPSAAIIGMAAGAEAPAPAGS